MDTAIVNTLALTMRDQKLGILPDATVGIDDGEIVFVGPSDTFTSTAERIIDGSDRLTLPGFVNVHAHTPLTLLRGAAQDVPEIEWMNDALGPFADAMSEHDRIAGARLGIVEALRSGTTTIGEFTTNAETILKNAHIPLGVRTVAAETINAVNVDAGSLVPDEPYPFDVDRGWDGLDQNETLFDTFADHPRVNCVYGPQALDMVPETVLSTIGERAIKHNRDIHMHVAQGQRERRQVNARYGDSTVGVLDDMDVPLNRLIAAHLHGAEQSERAKLAAAGTRLAANPSSITAIDGIVPPIVEYQHAGGTVGIGTDQAPGPGGHDFPRELRTSALLSKAARSDPAALPAWQALRLGTIEGARTLGIDNQVGSIEVGKRADLVLLDLNHPSVTPTVSTPLHTAIPNVVYGASGDIVSTVLVDGLPVVQHGTLCTGDQQQIIETANQRAQDLFARGESRWWSAESTLVDRVRDGWL